MQSSERKCDSMKPCSSCRRVSQVCTWVSQRRKREAVGWKVEAIRRYQAQLASQKHDATRGSPSLPNGPLQLSNSGPSPAAKTTSAAILPSPEPVGEFPDLTDMEISDFINWEGDLYVQAEPSYQVTPVEFDAKNSWPDVNFLPETSNLCHMGESNNDPIITSIPSPYHVFLPSQLFTDTTSFRLELICEQQILPWIEVFFGRLHQTLPIISRSSIYS
ncbi:hypothetical protein BKA65DRAFT_166874 [Rhexocercosporidium sp. MPI-PUGE-AT-0058]|nr:hypothetical protein BKA65DRAFT_166874 [Rhexocercosporidium sp. MPI-PUGE-AT-0058]